MRHLDTDQKAYDVCLPYGEGSVQLIDTVFFKHSTEEEVRESLINHDGYDPRIIVHERKEDGSWV